MPSKRSADLFKEHYFSRRTQRIIYRARRRVLRQLAGKFQDLIREVLGVRIRIEPKEAETLYQRLKEGIKGKQLPTIYQKIYRQKRWLARKWYSELRRRLERSIELAERYEMFRDSVYSLWKDIEALWRIYLRLKEDPYTVAAILSILLRGHPYPSEEVAECMTARQGYPGLGPVVANGRYVLDSYDAYQLIRRLQEIHPHRLYTICIFSEERSYVPKDWAVSDKHVRMDREIFRRVACIKTTPADITPGDIAAIIHADVVVLWAAERWPSMAGCT